MSHPGGRPPVFDNPDDMFLMFEEYKQWALENPLYHNEPIKSGDMAGQTFLVRHSRPLTIFGFAAYCKCSRQAIQNYGSKKGYEDFFGVYEQISTEMTAQNLEGGMCGMYNASLTARINGISENIEHQGLKEPPSELVVHLVSSKEDD